MDNRIILPLDVDTADRAVELAQAMAPEVGAFKVGLELVNSAGLGIFDRLRSAGASRIFYDSKFLDIPNTVAGASRAAAKLGLWLFNVHCTGGLEMMRAARAASEESAAAAGVQRPLVIGVTLLTSIGEATLNNELRVPGQVSDHVVHLARMAQQARLDGVVASPHEIEPIRAACGPDFLIITPGVRPTGADPGDQKRVMTPAEAISRGADYLVIGRPILRAPDPRAAARAIAAEMSGF